MKNFALLLLSVILWMDSPTASAQVISYQVKGQVVDSVSREHLELVSIQLRSAGSTLAQYVQLTDSAGRFLFDAVQSGNYELILSSVGYATKTMVVDVTQNMNLGTVQLPTSARALSQATVIAEKPVIIKTSEKTVFNVSQSPTHQTGTAEDALRNMPGVSVDRGGNISIIGKQGVKVLVDGKPSILAESNLQAFLKSIPANTIESIELITNPSARYDANGNAGIINIKLKKGKRDGLNGSVALGYGYPDRYNGNTLINYRKNKVNLFANYSLDYADVGHEFIDKRDISVNDSLSHYYMFNPSKEKNLSNTLKAGLDFFINDKNTLTYTFSGSNNWSRFIASALGQNMGADFNLINNYLSNTLNKGLNTSITNDVNYLKKYDSTDRELMVDFSHSYVDASSNSYLTSNGYDVAGNQQSGQGLDRSMLSTNHINNFIFQLNYAEPLKWKGSKIETGLKNETTINQNEYNVFDTKNGIRSANTLLSNSFNYLENIAAFYAIYSGAHRDWLTYSAGVRMEHTYIHSDKSNVGRNYVSLFPSGSISASLNKENNISLSYSRRVQRPEFRQINNNIIYFDQYSTWEGNPYLTPAFSNILSLSYTYIHKKTMLSISSDNTFVTGSFSESSGVDSLRITRGGIRNGGDSRTIGGSVYFKTDLTKWWSIQMNHSAAWQKFDYKKDVNTGAVSGVYYNIWASMDFKFWKNMIFNVNGWYNTGDFFPQGRSKQVGMMNVSLKKDFLKDRLTVSIVGQNLLNSMKFRWEVNNSNLHTNGSWQNFNRAIVLTVTYRFGSSTQAFSHKEIEENSRLGGGGGKGK